MIYFAKYRKGSPDFGKLDAAPIARYPWGGAYRPAAQARLCFVEGRGFLLRMTCQEAQPLARFTQADEPVYKDSCMELFLDCYPELALGYFNFECNANGALLCAFGPDRTRRRPLREERIAAAPQPEVLSVEGGWGFELVIPLELIQAYYGRCDFEKGAILAGNFYKCGDETPDPHFGCWAGKALTPQPDFHQPANFGQIILA